MSVQYAETPAPQGAHTTFSALQIAPQANPAPVATRPREDIPTMAITFKMKEQVHVQSLGWKQRLLKLNKNYQITTLSGPGDTQQHQIRLGDVEITASQGCFNRTNSVIARATAGTRRILDDLMAIGMLAYPPTQTRSSVKSEAAQ